MSDIIVRNIFYLEKRIPEFYPVTKFGQGLGDIWMSNVSCSGNEIDISRCSFSDWGHTGCQHGKDVGISCGKFFLGHMDQFSANQLRSGEIVAFTPFYALVVN